MQGDAGLFDDRAPFGVLALDVIGKPVPACRPSASSRYWRAAFLPASLVRNSFTPSLILSTIPGGVPAGANRANQPLASRPGKPDSSTVGTSGSSGRRLRLVTASPRSMPDWTCGTKVGMYWTESCRSPDARSGSACELMRYDTWPMEMPASLLRSWIVMWACDPTPTVPALSWAVLGLGVGHELFQILHRQLRTADKDQRRIGERRDRRKGAIGIEVEMLVQELVVDDRPDRTDQQSVAVRHRARRCARRNIAGRAGAVLDDEILTEFFAERDVDHTHQRVGARARRERTKHRHRPHWPRLGRACLGRECLGASAGAANEETAAALSARINCRRPMLAVISGPSAVRQLAAKPRRF